MTADEQRALLDAFLREQRAFARIPLPLRRLLLAWFLRGSGLAAVAVRLRLADMARLLADALAPALLDDPRRPLRLVNVAGGPALDSVNALLVLRRAHPGALAARPIAIDVLDSDADGPAFGE